MNDISGHGAPAYYDHVNLYNSRRRPSTVHVSNTTLHWFFARYLLQKAMSVFKWTMPELWAENYVLYSIYCWGFVSVVYTDKFGTIPQSCGLYGHDVMYQPTHVVISNPLLRGQLRPRIGTECSLLRLQPDYGGIYDLVCYYADLMALASETIGVNLLNSKLSYVFTAADKNSAESFKKLYDSYASGEPAVVIDKSLFSSNGNRKWEAFEQNVGGNYIVDRLLSDLNKIEKMFETAIGIPNANTDKRERLITDEVNSNNISTYSKTAIWLEQLQKGCENARSLFGIDLSVDWRWKDNVDSVNTGAVQAQSTDI